MERKCLLAIRIRGGVNAPTRVKDTLRMLRLEKNNTATLIDDRPDYMGMLQNAKDWITWGEPTIEIIQLLLKKRGEITGGSKIDSKTLKNLGYEDLQDLAKALHTCKIALNNLDNIKSFFRLHPPRKGFKNTIKRSYPARGELGYRGENINDLAHRMS